MGSHLAVLCRPRDMSFLLYESAPCMFTKVNGSAIGQFVDGYISAHEPIFTFLRYQCDECTN